MHVVDAPSLEPRVVIVDDDDATRDLLVYTLARDAISVVGSASNVLAGLDMIEAVRPDVVLVDLRMPGLGGVDLIHRVRSMPVRPAVLVLSGMDDSQSVADAIEAGADGYLLKGCTADELCSSVRDVAGGGSVLGPRVARDVVSGYSRLLTERRDRDFQVIETLAQTVEARDAVTGDHCRNVVRYGTALWKELTGDEPGRDIVFGFLLHDVGKIATPDSVLLKPGPLDDEERRIIREHVPAGVRVVQPLGFDRIVTTIIEHHHERWDGLGYPYGVARDDIPLAARVFAVVDAFDAMTTDRPYRSALTLQEALDELTGNAGTQFDPEPVRAFVSLVPRLVGA